MMTMPEQDHTLVNFDGHKLKKGKISGSLEEILEGLQSQLKLGLVSFH